MTIWVKPSGAKLDLNDDEATIDMAEELGWRREDAKKKAKAVESKKQDSMFGRPSKWQPQQS